MRFSQHAKQGGIKNSSRKVCAYGTSRIVFCGNVSSSHNNTCRHGSDSSSNAHSTHSMSCSNRGMRCVRVCVCVCACGGGGGVCVRVCVGWGGGGWVVGGGMEGSTFEGCNHDDMGQRRFQRACAKRGWMGSNRNDNKRHNKQEEDDNDDASNCFKSDYPKSLQAPPPPTATTTHTTTDQNMVL